MLKALLACDKEIRDEIDGILKKYITLWESNRNAYDVYHATLATKGHVLP